MIILTRNTLKVLFYFLKSGELCAMNCILFSLRIPFIDDLPINEAKIIAHNLDRLSGINVSQTVYKEPNVSQKVCAFITSQLFQGKLLFPVGKDMKMHAKVYFII